MGDGTRGQNNGGSRIDGLEDLEQKQNTANNFFKNVGNPIEVNQQVDPDGKSEDGRANAQKEESKDDPAGQKAKQKKSVKIVLPGESSDGAGSEADQFAAQRAD